MHTREANGRLIVPADGIMLVIGEERRPRSVAVFWAAHRASHRLTCPCLRGVLVGKTQ